MAISQIINGAVGLIPSHLIFEGQRDYMWEVIFPPLSRGGNLIGKAFSIFDTYTVSKYCVQVSFGQYEIEEVKSMRKGAKQEFIPGRMKIDEIQMRFLVPVPDSIYNYFSTWKDAIVDESGNYNPQNMYKNTINVLLISTHGITTHRVKLKGCFPKTYPKFELAYDSEKVLQYSIVLSVDDIEVSGMELMSSIPRVLTKVIGSNPTDIQIGDKFSF